MLFKDLKGKVYDTSGIYGMESVGYEHNPPHPIWWILWLIIFWPALFYLLILSFRPAFVLCFNHKGDRIQTKVDLDTYNLLCSKGLIA